MCAGVQAKGREGAKRQAIADCEEMRISERGTRGGSWFLVPRLGHPDPWVGGSSQSGSRNRGWTDSRGRKGAEHPTPNIHHPMVSRFAGVFFDLIPRAG